MALTRLGPNNSTNITGINLTSQVTGTLPTANGGTGATSFAAGKVLQLVSGNYTSQASTTSTSFQDLSTNTNVSITPASTSNKVLVMAHFNELYYNGTTSMYLDVTAAGSQIVSSHSMYFPSLSGEKLHLADLIFLPRLEVLFHSSIYSVWQVV